MLSRRDFLRSSSLLALAPTVPLFVAQTGRAAAAGADRRVLVVVQLDGGNDALNTVIPHADPAYAKLRPTLKVNSKDVIKLTDEVGLHPSLRPLDKLLQAGQLAVLPGVGYPNPNRSHFESMAIWHTARFDAEERQGYGWLGRALDGVQGSSYVIGTAVPGAVRGARSAAASLSRVEDVLLADPGVLGRFAPNAADPAKKSVGPDSKDDLLAYIRRQAVDAQSAGEKLASLARGGDGGKYPATALADRLRLAARLLKADLGARVIYTLQAGYDTHASQRFAHAGLLSEFAGAVAAFFEDLKEAKLADRVVLLAFSEFGRTIKENGSAGTDHGTAGAVFLAGPGVKGGLAGTMPSLADLDKGEPKMTADFRRVYASVLAGWLGLPDRAALGGAFEPLPLLR
jgi:uncharacterized protein (DUF1501 family)